MMASSGDSISRNNQATKPKVVTLRRVSVFVLWTLLPFALTVFGSYLVSAHTRDGKLAMWLVFHSQTMTDQQLAHAIGEDPFAVLRRAGLMMKAIDPVVAIIVGIFVAFTEKKRPGRMVALVLTPFYLWDFAMSAFSTPRTPAGTLLEIAKVLGANAAYTAMAVLVAIAIAFLTSRASLEPAAP
jgi:hypothetical protein